MMMAVAMPAMAVMDHMSTPLVVVRFNQPRVYYDQPLYNALTLAVQAKSDVRFNVINYFPVQPGLRQMADNNFRRVLTSIRKMGVPDSRLNLRSEPAPDLNYSEVHIYVR